MKVFMLFFPVVDYLLFANGFLPTVATTEKVPSLPSSSSDQHISRFHWTSATELAANRPQDVNFAAPLLDYGYPPAVQDFRDGSLSSKPILLYLPGFDGTYICPFMQFPELGTEFEVWCMTVGMKDRSTFVELRQHVLDFVDKITEIQNRTTQGEAEVTLEAESNLQRRPIYLVGESFGGILAAEAALSLLETKDYNLKGLTLINPATCYDQSALNRDGPPVYQLPFYRYPFGLGSLLPLFTDEFSVAQLLLILRAKGLPSVIDTPARESYMGRVAFSLPSKLEYMNQGTLKWRLEEWLTLGCQGIQARLADFRFHKSLQTLIVVGECDKTLPSVREAERLSQILPNVRVHLVEGAGHASTCGSRVDLTAEMRCSFSELQLSSQGNHYEKRTAMKPSAAKGTGAYLGMEERYDRASIGLNPIRYWSKENFQRIPKTIIEVKTHTTDGVERIYKRSEYSTT